LRATDAALLIVALVIAWSFYRSHLNKTNTFDLFDLLMEGGRLSRIACAFMATLVVTSWVIIRLTIEGKLTEGLFTAYVAAWVAPIVAKLFSGPSSTATATSTTSVSTTVTP
jgi:hypothetical protein